MKPMHRSFILASLGTAAAFVLIGGGCQAEYQSGKDDPNFGAPNALAGQRAPGTSSDNATGDGGGGGGASGTPKCVAAGGQIVDGGACAVSFKTDILGAFGNGKGNCGVTGCHGGDPPQYEPPIDPGDPNKMWNVFQKFSLSNGKPYINPCSTDPAQSTIACNINSATPCGSLMPKGTPLPADVVTKFDTWLKCGSPNN